MNITTYLRIIYFYSLFMSIFSLYVLQFFCFLNYTQNSVYKAFIEEKKLCLQTILTVYKAYIVENGKVYISLSCRKGQ